MDNSEEAPNESEQNESKDNEMDDEGHLEQLRQIDGNIGEDDENSVNEEIE